MVRMKYYIPLRLLRNYRILFLQYLKATGNGLLLRRCDCSYGNGADEGGDGMCDAAVVSCCHFISRSSRKYEQSCSD